jgi:hypothetical protein
MAKHDGTREQDRKKTHRNLADLYDLTGDYPLAVQRYTEEMKFVSSLPEKTEILRRIGMIWGKRRFNRSFEILFRRSGTH